MLLSRVSWLCPSCREDDVSSLSCQIRHNRTVCSRLKKILSGTVDGRCAKPFTFRRTSIIAALRAAAEISGDHLEAGPALQKRPSIGLSPCSDTQGLVAALERLQHGHDCAVS
jgi:hypothetical protein